jgi:transposase
MNNNFSYFIGIDISKDSFNFAIIDNNFSTIEDGKLNMDYEGFQKIKQLISQFHNSIVALESTGIYHINILSFLISFKKEVCLINPSVIKQFSKSVSLRNTKTDKIDATVIAKFIAKYPEHTRFFTLSHIDELTALARTRENIAKQIAKVKTQLKQHLIIAFPEILHHYNIFTDSFLHILLNFPSAKAIKKASYKQILNSFTHIKGRAANISVKQLKKLANKSISSASHIIENIIQHDIKHLLFLNEQLKSITDIFIQKVNDSKKDDMDILKSIKGISDTTAAHIISEVKNIDRFENKNKFIAFFGTDPSFKQSGTSIYARGKISKKGSKSLRRTIYLVASSLIRCNKYFKIYYDKKRKEGFCHRKAIIALCNKVIRIIFTLLKKRVKFDEQLYCKKCGISYLA